MKLYRTISLIVTILMVLSVTFVPNAPVQATVDQPKPVETLAAQVKDLAPLAFTPPGPVTPTCTDCYTTSIRVDKVADNPEVNAGDPIGYTIFVTNTGKKTATNLFVDDPFLPAGTTWSTDDPACHFEGTRLMCTYAELKPGQSVSIHVTAMSTAEMCGMVSNKAYAKADNTERMMSNWTYISIICPVTFPDLTVSKTAENNSINPGEAARFTMTVTNEGDGPAEDVRLSDPLPLTADLTWGIDSGGNGSQCAITDGVLDCAFGTLPPGESRTVTISAVVPGERCDLVIVNSVTVSASNEDPVQYEDNQDSATIYLNCTTLELTKEADITTVGPDSPIGFLLTVTNTGDFAATDVTLTDQLDNRIVWTPDNAACVIDEGGLMTCTLGDLQPGETVTVHITTTATPEVCGLLENTATVTAGNFTQEVRATADILIDCCPNLNIIKVANDHSVFPGERAIYTITVRNVGTGPVTNAGLNDPLPAVLDWVIDPGGDGAACAITDGVLSCSFGTMMPNDVRRVTISAPTTAETCGETISNTATATSDNEAPEDLINNVDSDDILLACPSFQVSKVAESPVVGPDDLITFDITVSNGTTAALTGVTLTDTLTFGINWTSTNSSRCSISGGVLTCNFGDLAAGSTAQVSITGESTEELCGEQLENIATASATGLDPVSGSDAVNVVCHPDVTITKTASQADVNLGEDASFRIVASNTGTAAATNVEINDPLPNADLFAWALAEPVEGCAITGGVLNCSFAALQAGENRMIEVTAPVNSSSCTAQITNTATISAENEPVDDTGDNSSSATIDMNCSTLRIAKTAVSGIVDQGEPISFTITATNQGDAPLTNVSVIDQLSPLFTWSVDNNTDCTLVDGMLECTFAELAANASAEVTVTTQTPPTQEQCETIIENTASASADGLTPVMATASVFVSCTPPEDIDVRVTKTAEQPLIFLNESQPIETARFTMTVENIGAGAATGVTLTDPLPDPIFEPAFGASTPALLTWSVDSADDGADCLISGGQLTCEFGTLPAGETRTVSVSAPVSYSAFQAALGNNPYTISYNNLATVAATNETAGDNNQSSARLQIFYTGSPIVLPCYSPNLVYRTNFSTTPSGAATWFNYRDSRTNMPQINEIFLGGYSGNERAAIEFTPEERTPENGFETYFIQVKFDFYAMGSWDGIAIPGPDHFKVELLNSSNEVQKDLLDYTFSNFNDNDEYLRKFRQSFPGMSPYFSNDARTGAKATNTLGYIYLNSVRDSVYPIVLNLPMTTETLRLGFHGTGLQVLTDEAWGIDNLRINTCVHIPAPVIVSTIYTPWVGFPTGALPTPAATTSAIPSAGVSLPEDK